MDLGLRSSAYEKLHYEGRDGEQLDVELAEVPRSRAQSYKSSTNSFERAEDNDGQSLIGHVRSISGFNLQGDTRTPYNIVDRTLQTPNRRRPRRREGWRFGVTVAGYTALTVLLLNLLFAIIVGARWRDENGVVTVFTGQCGYVNHVTTWVHVLINVIASLLLSASNFTMQALSAPVREEIDRAHSKGDWMDIGIASIRNLSKIRWPRAVACLILASTSIPIHLLYNSALFKSIDSNEYFSVVANPKWLEGGNYTTWDSAKNLSYIEEWSLLSSTPLDDLQNYFMNATALEKAGDVRNLSSSECLTNYGQQFLSDFSNVIAVTNEVGASPNNTIFYVNSPLFSSGVQDTSSWICYDSPGCDPQSMAKSPANWEIKGKTIDYCLARVTPERCKLKVSLNVLIAVIICNAAKTLVIFWTLFHQKEATLVTIGDAIASYLERPDEKTKGRCLMSKADIKSWKLRSDIHTWNSESSPEIEQRSKLPWLSSLLSKTDFHSWKPQFRDRRNRAPAKPNTDPSPRPFRAVNKRWFAAASTRRWITIMGLITITLAAAIALLTQGVQQLRDFSTNPFGIGFGTINSLALLGDVGYYSGLVPMVLLANTPQLIASILYVMYNGLLTSMLLAKEWAQYAKTRKTLRVTSPRGQQRSTHYLQLPLRYSVPIVIMSAVLHWAISQSLFVAVIDLYYEGEDQGDQVQVGFSCPPIVLAVLIGALLSIGALVMGFIRFHSQIPVASHCSVAIAAACHPPKDDPDAALLPVMWGQVEGMSTQEIGHCSFTSQAVEPLILGKMYAGARMTAGSDGVREAESFTAEGLI